MTADFGRELKRIREAAGVSQKDLADAVGIKSPSLSQIESGKIGPSVETLYRLCRELKVSADHFAKFFLDDGEPVAPPPPQPPTKKARKRRSPARPRRRPSDSGGVV